MNTVQHLRPSGAAVWSVCGGYVAMRAAYPDAPEEADNDVCEDGTACHWLASEVWNGRQPAIGSLSPNNRVITEDMYDAVAMYHGVLRSEAWKDGETYIEQSISCDVIYPNMTGTPDAATYIPTRLRVVDLKYGFKYVEVWYNGQLIIYAAALAKLLKLPDDALVELVIVQPRNFHRDGPVRTWTTTVGEIRKLAAELSKKACDAMRPAPDYVPNPGCVDCPGRHVCPALAAASYVAMEVAYKGVPLDMPPQAIGRELDLLKTAAKRLEARISGIESHAESLLRDGKQVPGWVLQATFSRETWRPGGEEALLRLAQHFGKNVAKPQRAVTPNQARELGIPIAVVSQFSHRPSTGVRLTKLDPHEAVKASSRQPLR